MSKHIRVEQVNNTERINNNVLNKIYDIAYKDDLIGNIIDNSSDFNGTVSVDYAHKSIIDKIISKFISFTINLLGYYVDFKDKLVESLLATAIGNGEGVTQQNIANVTSNDTIAAIDFNGATSFHEFGQFSLSRIGSDNPGWSNGTGKIQFKTINKITVPYTFIGNGSSIEFNYPVYEFICPNLTQMTFQWNDNLDGIFYIGSSSYDYCNQSNFTGFRRSNGTEFERRNKMLYLPNITSITCSRGCESAFGNETWRKDTPWKIVYIKGIYGQKTSIPSSAFYYTDILHLIINNNVLPDILTGLLDAKNVWLPSSLLTASTVNGITTYSMIDENNPWAAAGKTPIFHNIEDFQTVETLEDWENEGMPVKLVKELM